LRLFSSMLDCRRSTTPSMGWKVWWPVATSRRTRQRIFAAKVVLQNIHEIGALADAGALLLSNFASKGIFFWII